MDSLIARSLLETVQAAYPKVIVNDKSVEVWRAALDGCDGVEVGDALLTWLRENPRQPTPADLLRVMREARARLSPECSHDPREVIPLQDAAATILADLVARMRSGAPAGRMED